MDFKLTKSVDIDGEKKETLDYDFDNLTGKDINDMFGELAKSKHAMVGPYEMDPVVCAAAFAKAAQIDFMDLTRFSAKDYVRASNLGRNFFISGSNGTQTSEN